jgi:hypothetical protein
LIKKYKSGIKNEIRPVTIPKNLTVYKLIISAKICAGVTMKKSRFVDTQIVGILNEVEVEMKT